MRPGPGNSYPPTNRPKQGAHASKTGAILQNINSRFVLFVYKKITNFKEILSNNI